MDSVIVFGTQKEAMQVKMFLDTLPPGARASVIAIDDSQVEGCELATTFSGSKDLWDALLAASQTCKGNHITLINACSGLSSAEMAKLALSTMDKNQSIGTFSLMNSMSELTTAHFCAGDLVNTISQSRQLPLFALKVSKDFLLANTRPESQSVTGIFYSLLISAVSEFISIDADIVCIHSSQIKEDSLVPEIAEISKLLRQAISTINIEELFPNKPWQSAQNETAASCYQLLAAQFISMNDLQSAEECIILSEQLEDTPRSLALKGIVAMLKGEELEAVANMVSSLQEYERYKKDSSHSNIKVNPTAESLEIINTSLQSGLEALNSRDNAQAANHFAAALFRFDSFFSESGLRMPQ